MLSIDDILDAAFTQEMDWQQFQYDTVAEFFRAGLVLNPETGEALEPVDEQYTVLDTLSQTDDDGNFKYDTWIYSAPKKSGKTTFTAGIMLWQAWRIPNGIITIVANDLKQADSRMFRVCEYIVTHHPKMKDHATVVRYEIRLDNGTIIQAVPLDPSGEAGGNPTAIGLTEAWAFKSRKADLMWTETNLSPTRAGQSFKLIESYAGHSGESLILERLYNAVVKPELCIDPARELYANPAAGIIAYWRTERIMSWQRDAQGRKYYANEAATKTPQEYRRQHHNEWVLSVAVFIDPATWAACKTPFEQMDPSRKVVIGMDAAVSNDTFALVGVSRKGDIIYEKFTYIWHAPKDGTIDFDAVEQTIYKLSNDWTIVQITYDPHQLHDMASRLKRKFWTKEFKQGDPRLIADKALQTRLINGTLRHTGHAELTEQVLNANAKTDNDETRLRIIQRNKDLKIDAAVALSMAAHIASGLNIG